MSKKTVLSAALLAALQSGAPAAVDPPAADAAPAAAAPAAESDEPDPAAPAVEPPAAVAEAAPAAATDPAAPAAPSAVETDLMRYLREQNTSLQTQLSTVTAEVAALKAKNAQLEAASPRLTKIVRTAASRMAIALGSKPVGIESLEGVVLADQFDSLDADFAKRFVVGGRAEAAAVDSTASESSAPTSVRRGVKATKL